MNFSGSSLGVIEGDSDDDEGNDTTVLLLQRSSVNNLTVASAPFGMDLDVHSNRSSIAAAVRKILLFFAPHRSINFVCFFSGRHSQSRRHINSTVTRRDTDSRQNENKLHHALKMAARNCALQCSRSKSLLSH